MKKLLSTLLAICLVCGNAAFAEPAQPSLTAEESTATDIPVSSEPDADLTASPITAQANSVPDNEFPDVEYSTQLNLEISVIPHKYIKSTNAVIELYTDNDEYLGSCLRYVGFDTPSVTMSYQVPRYHLGTHFKIKLKEGLNSILYYDEIGNPEDMVRVETYGYYDENGEYITHDSISISADPEYEKEVNLYITDTWYRDMWPHARMVDGVAMAPVRQMAEAMGLDVYYNGEWDSVTLSIDDHSSSFWAYNEYMTYPGGDANAEHMPVYIDDTLFVPVKDLANAFDCPLEVTDYGVCIDFLIGEAPYHQEIRNRTPVNADGIGSKTDYLIWVSKSEYAVRVYHGQQYHWTLIDEFPCALGAWNTPTITGQFEILERTRWDYPSYYVAPVLRFYNGYALHSTLLSYGGGEYDGRVGVNISHGCVRLHPWDINWINDTVPYGTRVYITE